MTLRRKCYYLKNAQNLPYSTKIVSLGETFKLALQAKMSVSALLKKSAQDLITASYELFIEGDKSVFPEDPIAAYTSQEILAIKSFKKAVFCSYFCEEKVNIPVENFQINTELDMMLFGIFYRKTEPGDINMASMEAQKILSFHRGCIVFIIPELFHTIVEHSKGLIDENSPTLQFLEDPTMVQYGEEVMGCYEAAKMMKNHPQLQDLINHIIDNFELFSTRMF